MLPSWCHHCHLICPRKTYAQAHHQSCLHCSSPQHHLQHPSPHTSSHVNLEPFPWITSCNSRLLLLSSVTSTHLCGNAGSEHNKLSDRHASERNRSKQVIPICSSPGFCCHTSGCVTWLICSGVCSVSELLQTEDNKNTCVRNESCRNYTLCTDTVRAAHMCTNTVISECNHSTVKL